ncbi:formyltransferase family protein [Cylindrospermopsis curvispora]|uniref:Methionyl-tRNA formyltransferase n=1 Tax=Cylindrospermopsis curvispora GIHE-G1 TaxID=2666332 RepID=A0A7H0F1P7_9CYAN|nr:formyltransferase family protein [Cylindrospermopsis curvispora]QNP29963.1 methionyl-tRNA formyltransferase [Cylindrospermopsis curvispora GIHE-G1]
MLTDWLEEGHHVKWTHHIRDLQGGDLCFYLSYGKIVPPSVLSQFKHNLVVHESELPQGKGWSPLTWQILEGKNDIPVTLFEAAKQVDSGNIYLQQWLHFQGHETIDELRHAQAQSTLELCKEFVREYPDILKRTRPQVGKSSFYPRRTPQDSKLDPHISIGDQFNLLRVVDNERYPAFFDWAGRLYVVKIYGQPAL